MAQCCQTTTLQRDEGMKPNIEYTVQIRNSYQYFMKAPVEAVSCNGAFTLLENVIGARVAEFLNRPNCYR
jgi:hypothetical protein